MWEEDPRYQEANYRLLLFLVAALSIGVAAWSALTHEWAMLGNWLFGLLTVVLALSFYAAVVWTVVRSIRWLVRVFKNAFHKKHDA